MKIEQVPGVPKFFAWFHHTVMRFTVCRRRGHEYTRWRSCNQCGGYLE